MIARFVKKKVKLLLLRIFNIKISKIKKDIFKNTTISDRTVIDTLYNCKGIIHIGAHRGSERYIYDWFGKKVIWVEANPNIFDELQIKFLNSNIK